MHSAGTVLVSLSNQLAEIVADPKNSHLELYLQRLKLDENGAKIVEDGMWLAEILHIGLNGFGQRTQAMLEREFDKAPIIAILALWVRYGAGTLGTLRVRLMDDDNPQVVKKRDYDAWERQVIPDYMKRHRL